MGGLIPGFNMGPIWAAHIFYVGHLGLGGHGLWVG